ncbi:MAG: CvpA family protein [Paludibacteraceae bacterium]|jgi:membrane protein required for colicin V production|nr:CvpA family protein [Paludibacteraceae bacterium]MED9995518.1 CvpA family protein [Paludibacteraceae bacterium]
MEFNWLDIALGIPLLYGIVSGLFKGIVQSVGSLIGLVLGIVLAYVYAKPFSQQLIQWFVLTPDQSYAISFVLLFIAVVVVCALLVKIIDKFLSLVTLGWINKLLGGVFGLLKFALLLSVLIHLVDMVDQRFNWIQPQVKQNSLFYKPVKAVLPTVMPYVHLYLDKHNETTR